MRLSGALRGTIFVVWAIFATACGGGSNQSAETHSFEGIWLEESILEFRESGDNQYLCDRLELMNGEYELTIDGFQISATGNVRDFSLHRQTGVMWRVRSDGSTYDNLLVDRAENFDSNSQLVSNQMRKVDPDTITNTWVVMSEGNPNELNPIFYHRSSEEEVAQLKQIVEECPKN